MARYVDVDELALIATRVYDRFERTATTHEDTVLNKAVYETLQVIIENAPKADVVPAETVREMKSELCFYCGRYEEGHLGACDGCKWREI